MPRGGRRHHRRPKLPQSMIEFHTQLSGRFNYLTLCNDVSLYSGMITNNSGEGCTLLFIIPEVKKIFKTGSTFSFNCNVVLGPSFGNALQKLYVIMGMHNNVAFIIGFALMSESTKSAFKALYYKILSIEPRWKPQTIICCFNTEEANAITEVFPNTIIQGCWFYFCKKVWEQLEGLDLRSFCNTDRITFDYMHMCTAIPLLPTEHTVNGFIDLKANLIRILQPYLRSEYCRKFNTFFTMFRELWFEGVNGEIIPMKDAQVLRSNIEIDLCSQQLQANMEHHTNPAPWPFIRSLVAYSKLAIFNYQTPNESYYDNLEYPRSTLIKHIEIYNQNLIDFYAGRIHVFQYLVNVMSTTPGYVFCDELHIPLEDDSLPATWHLQKVEAYYEEIEIDSDYNYVYDDDDESLLFDESDTSYEDDESSDEEIPNEPPSLVPFLPNEMNFKPVVEEMCCICLSACPQIMASPCMHQCMCVSCYEYSIKLRPFRHRPYYRCPLCRNQIDLYMNIN